MTQPHITPKPSHSPGFERELAAVRRGVREALLRHAREGNPVAISRDGQVVWLSPAEILAEVARLDKIPQESHSPAETKSS